MRILCTSNPLVGHWLPMLPLARAAQEAGHDVVIATGPMLFLRSNDVGSRPGRSAPISKRYRPVYGAAPVHQPKLTRTGWPFADPAIARARDLLDRTVDWGPDMVVQEIYELGGTYIPAHLHVLHGLGAHYPNFIKLAELALAHVRTTLGEPARRVPMAATTAQGWPSRRHGCTDRCRARFLPQPSAVVGLCGYSRSRAGES